jgi:uncharacterized protein YecE (DUF72 family)
MILVGTVGYQPTKRQGTRKKTDVREVASMAHHARRFGTVEVEWDCFPPGGGGGLVPESFRWVLRLPRSLTHGRELSPALAFDLASLAETGRLACLLAPFPLDFSNRPENQRFLQRLQSWAGELPLAVQFLNKEWIVEGMEAWLRTIGLCYCAVDLPRLPGLTQPVAWVTGPVAMVRLCGRDAAYWQTNPDRGPDQEYVYDLLELAEWLPKIEEMSALAPLTLVIANGSRSAQMLSDLLDVPTRPEAGR